MSHRKVRLHQEHGHFLQVMIREVLHSSVSSFLQSGNNVIKFDDKHFRASLICGVELSWQGCFRFCLCEEKFPSFVSKSGTTLGTTLLKYIALLTTPKSGNSPTIFLSDHLLKLCFSINTSDITPSLSINE